MEKLIITVLGHDRPGIIAAISKSLYDLECNIENVSQMVLQSEFAGLFVISGPESSSMKEIEQGLSRDLAPLELDVHAKRLAPRQEEFDSKDFEPFIITTTGPDQKGLVARITGVLAEHGANVTNLKAVFKGGDDPARNIMVYEVAVPSDADSSALKESLRKKAGELGLDMSIQHRNIFDAVNKI